uniref:Uncharacterized protein n=1 Tax=Heterosigma akashiwo TaxID=2829 RepID=A0A7S4DCC8_HETAK
MVQPGPMVASSPPISTAGSSRPRVSCAPLDQQCPPSISTAGSSRPRASCAPLDQQHQHRAKLQGRRGVLHELHVRHAARGVLHVGLCRANLQHTSCCRRA